MKAPWILADRLGNASAAFRTKREAVAIGSGLGVKAERRARTKRESDGVYRIIRPRGTPTPRYEKRRLPRYVVRKDAFPAWRAERLAERGIPSLLPPLRRRKRGSR